MRLPAHLRLWDTEENSFPDRSWSSTWGKQITPLHPPPRVLEGRAHDATIGVEAV